jgi:hypothetical protein
MITTCLQNIDSVYLDSRVFRSAGTAREVTCHIRREMNCLPVVMQLVASDDSTDTVGKEHVDVSPVVPD